MQENAKLNIYQKLAKIRKNVEVLQKNKKGYGYTYVSEDTILANMYLSGNYKPISLKYYLSALSYIITHISPNIVVHRISGDAPKDLLLAPDWNLHKKWVLNGLDKILEEKDLWQGKYYKQKNDM